MESSYSNIKVKTAEVISAEIMKLLGLTEDKYVELKYELSYTWIVNFNKYNACRMFAVSSVFHKWWSQAVAWREREIIVKLHYTNRNRLELYKEYMISIPVYPSPVVCNNIINEGISIIKNQPNLKKIRL